MISNLFSILGRIRRAQCNDRNFMATQPCSYFSDNLESVVLWEVQIQNKEMRDWYLGVTLKRFQEINCVRPILSTDKLVVDPMLAKSFLHDHCIDVIVLGKKNPARRTG